MTAQGMEMLDYQREVLLKEHLQGRGIRDRAVLATMRVPEQ